MPSIDTNPILLCESQRTWEDWLERHHDTSTGVWLKIAKKGGGGAQGGGGAPYPTVTYPEAIESALIYGWIDGQKGAVDGHFYRQRFCRRTPRSKWSQINVEKATALIDSGRMKAPGLEQVEKAKQDGRWENAYEPPSRAVVPDDLQRELDCNPGAKAFFETLTGANRYAILFRIKDAKRPETRAKRIAQFVQMLNEGKTLH